MPLVWRFICTRQRSTPPTGGLHYNPFGSLAENSAQKRKNSRAGLKKMQINLNFAKRPKFWYLGYSFMHSSVKKCWGMCVILPPEVGHTHKKKESLGKGTKNNRIKLNIAEKREFEDGGCSFTRAPVGSFTPPRKKSPEVRHKNAPKKRIIPRNEMAQKSEYIWILQKNGNVKILGICLLVRAFVRPSVRLPFIHNKTISGGSAPCVSAPGRCVEKWYQYKNNPGNGWRKERQFEDLRC